MAGIVIRVLWENEYFIASTGAIARRVWSARTMGARDNSQRNVARSPGVLSIAFWSVTHCLLDIGHVTHF
jgi:hypothetical protein